MRRPYFADTPDLSPDGSLIVFSLFTGGSSDLYAAHPDGSNLTRITDAPDAEVWASWTQVTEERAASSAPTTRRPQSYRRTRGQNRDMHVRRNSRSATWCAVVASALLGGCLGIGSCSETEAFAFNAIDHYGDEQLVPEAHPNGACGASLVTGDDPNAVIEHYRSELERVGFAVGPVESFPITDETGAVVGRTLVLQATIETATASINAEVLDGQDTTFMILMNEID